MRRKGNESLCSLHMGRQQGRYFHSPRPFERGVIRCFKLKKYLRGELEIVSPHRKAVSCLSLDGGCGRFLLAGSADATISLYDISKWGSEYFVRSGPVTPKARDHSFHPVARTMKIRERNTTTNAGSSLEERMATPTPVGHSFSISHVQWFPTDTGAFISTSIEGSCFLWDTNQMEPVLCVRPFGEEATFGSAHLQTGGDHSLLAACAWNDSSLKLIDLKSGSSSHELAGHGDGITQVQWSPTNSVILASGSRDGTVRLWDIRKSGSRACITILDQEASPSSKQLIPPYAGDYSHLRPSKISNINSRQQKSKSKKRKRNIAPNNYDLIQNTGKRSHGRGGYVAGLQFFPDGQRLASVGGPDGELLLWDLRLGVLEPSKFVAPGGLTTGVCTLPSRSTRRAAICIEKDGSIVWVGRHSTILGFEIDGGSPVQELNGHLHNVCSIDCTDPVRNLLSGSQEGMILCWGRPKANNVGQKRRVQEEDRDNW